MKNHCLYFSLAIVVCWCLPNAVLASNSTNGRGFTNPLPEQSFVKALNSGVGDLFGTSVAIDGDTLAVGAMFANSGRGAVYVYVRNGASWDVQAFLTASNPNLDDFFGRSIALSGDTLVVGAHGEDSDGSDESNNDADRAGAVYVFTRSGTTWSQQAYLKSDNADSQDSFGLCVAISGDTLVVCAPGEDGSAAGSGGDNALDASGAAFVFTRSGSSWSQQAYLKASNAESEDLFGSSVAISGDTLVVGARDEDGASGGDGSDNDTENAGAAYVFVRSGSTWNQQAHLKATFAGPFYLFGATVAIDGDTVAIGSTFENGSGEDGEAVYVFVRNGSDWERQGYLQARNGEESDAFGSSLSIDVDKIAVGAAQEKSNGFDPADNSLQSGAAYVFTRIRSSWFQQAYLKASNADRFDEFGAAVGIVGNTAVVGATGEDSNSNAGQSDNSAEDAGAAYIYEIPDVVIVPIDVNANDVESYIGAPNSQLNSTDLEFDDLRTVGVRFPGVDVPPNSTITGAFLQFHAEESDAVPTTTDIEAEASDDADPFSPDGIAGRVGTAAQARWSVPEWVAEEAGSDQQTPDLSALVQEVVSRGGWQSGNAIAFWLRSQGMRSAYSHDGDPSKSPILVVDYVNETPTVAAPSISPGGGAFVNSALVRMSSNTPGATIFYTTDGSTPDATGFAYGGPFLVDTDTTVKAIALFDGYSPSAVVEAVFNIPASTTTLQALRLSLQAAGDDAEERANGSISLTSDDLEMTQANAGPQIVGLRFANVTIPVGSTVTYAFLQFTAEESSAGDADLAIAAQVHPNPLAFDRRRHDITSRKKTEVSVFWNVPDWSSGDSGFAQISPDLTALIQSIVDRAGWTSGNALALFVSGSGLREAHSFDSNPNKAAVLHIEFDPH